MEKAVVLTIKVRVSSVRDAEDDPVGPAIAEVRDRLHMDAHRDRHQTTVRVLSVEASSGDDNEDEEVILPPTEITSPSGKKYKVTDSGEKPLDDDVPPSSANQDWG
jgi:hypothetical protein